MASSHGGKVFGRGSIPVRMSAVAAPMTVIGYRHMFGAPTRRWAEGIPEAELQARLAVLARLMAFETAMTADHSAFENPTIPSGYTYLLQLVAHDCVATPTPFWALPEALKQARNARPARLRLETLYGGGPSVCPHAYEPDDARDASRSRLRLGPMKPLSPGGAAPLRDIGRVAIPPMPGAGHGKPGAGVLADPLICDPRNEDNAFLAQMTALFHLLHNTLLGLLPAGRAAPQDRFACAREATTLLYRRILREDVLARLLHHDVLQVYQDIWQAAAPERLLDRSPDPSVPLEFSHAAFRFAHAMVRPTYRMPGARTPLSVSDALSATSARNPRRMPLDESWILGWRHFFEIAPGGPIQPNASLRITPRHSHGLFDSHHFPWPGPEGAGDPWRGNVAFRDQMSAARSGLWSVDALYGRIGALIAQRGGAWDGLLARAPLASAASRAAALKAWLLSRTRSPEAHRAALDWLAEDPPLPFYVLFEAEAESGGTRLGRLGSILVGEVLFGQMLEDPLQGERAATPLRELAAGFGFGAALDGAEGISTMARLITFVAECNALQDATPPFL